jgi:pimeloyl-ACP methyl ester carboxylesterase
MRARPDQSRGSTRRLTDQGKPNPIAQKCTAPPLWLQGTADRAYSVRNAEDEIGRFVNSANAELRVIEEGQHFLSATSPEVVNPAIVEFIKRW